MTHPISSGERDLRSAVLRGARGDCPACGQAALFRHFLKPVGHCDACGERWSGHQADDMPAYLVVLALGHILVPALVAAHLSFAMPMWAEMLIWPGMAVILAVIMIQPAKGAVIGFQWARRMHGFAGGR